MLFRVGEFAWPGVNFLFHCIGFAVVLFAIMGAYSIYKVWNQP